MLTEPTNLRIVGRGKLTASASAIGRELTIRIDDVRDPAFWAEITLTADQVRELLDAEEEACDHNTMIECQEEGFAWQCADCGHVYGK